MPSRIPVKGYANQSYGTPMVPQYSGSRRFNDPLGYGMPQGINPYLATPSITLGWPANGVRAARYPITPSNSRLGTYVASGKGPRSWFPRGGASDITWPGGVAAQTPATRPYASLAPLLGGGTAQPGYGTRGPNVVNPLFGRPGFSYTYAQPRSRLGPAFKGAPGTGKSGRDAGRSLGFQPTGYAHQQHMDLHQFDYSPPTDPDFNVGSADAFHGVQQKVIPRSIGVGMDGKDIVGTYRAHDFTPADRFFKQGRAAANWQDMSFGPEYRFLTPYQQVARYNLYNNINLARPLSSESYFLGYQTQAGVSSQIGGNLGQGRPLGY